MLATDHRMRGLHLQKESRRASRALWELGRAVPGTITMDAQGRCASTLSSLPFPIDPDLQNRAGKSAT